MSDIRLRRLERIASDIEARLGALEARLAPPEEIANAAAPVEEPIGAGDRLREAYRQKFGSLPHHRMKPETIRMALDK